MTKFKIISVGATAIAAVVVSATIQHQMQAKYAAGQRSLQEQSNQLAALTVEHERLSSLVAHAVGAQVDDHAAEVARLRSEAAMLEKQTNHLGQSLVKSHEAWPARHMSNQQIYTPEYQQQLHLMAVNRMEDAKVLGIAFESYADDHQKQSPVNIDQLAPYLAEEAKKGYRSFSGSNQFEIVYQGSLDQLQGLPWGSVAVVRDQKPWLGPNGKMKRVYGFPDGHSQIVGSDDNFQSYEAQHVIMPMTADSSGQ
jgi:hypothetical protein